MRTMMHFKQQVERFATLEQFPNDRSSIQSFSLQHSMHYVNKNDSFYLISKTEEECVQHNYMLTKNSQNNILDSIFQI